jgi:outer membrane protein TolC
MRVLAILITQILFFSGCSVHSIRENQLPLVDAEAFHSPQGDKELSRDISWWIVFEDETLNTLIEKSLSDNFSIEVATARLKQAETLYRQARGIRGPEIGLHVGSRQDWDKDSKV